MLEVIGGLTPSVGVAFLFWFAMRAIINADRRERAAEAEFERAQRAASAPRVGKQPTAAQEADTEPPGSDAVGSEGAASPR